VSHREVKEVAFQRRVGGCASGVVMFRATCAGHRRHITKNADMRWARTVTGSKYSQQLFTLENTVCNRTFPDLTDDIIASMTDILFCTSIARAAYPPYEKQEITAIQVLQVLVFQINHVYLYVAAGIAMLANVLTTVAVAFHGFWRLGRTVTLSPVDKALGARFGSTSLGGQLL
jgi:hypothetical protein